MALARSPDNCLSNTHKNYRNFLSSGRRRYEYQKMVIFRHCLKIAGNAENGGKFSGAKPKIYYIKSAQYFASLTAGTLMQNIYTHWVLQFVMSEYAVQR